MDRIGQVVGDRFRVDAGDRPGAMAEVYPRADLQTAGAVALKILRYTHIRTACRSPRFAREGEVQAKLRHRNVAALLDRASPTSTSPTSRSSCCAARPCAG